MAIEVRKHIIEKIHIIEDDPNARDAYQGLINILGVEPIPEEGPFYELSQVISRIGREKTAVICDYNLTQRKYANFKGAETVAEFYKIGVPAILCTRYGVAEVDEIRKYRRWVPVLLTPQELNTDSIEEGINKCISEFENNIPEDRKAWRTLVRIDDVDENEGIFFVIIPGWNAYQAVKLYLDSVPNNIKQRILSGDLRFFAEVNVGAESSEDLFFDNWE